MESHAAILSRDKEETTPRATDVNVNDRVRRPRSVPIHPEGVEERTRKRGTTKDRDRKHLQHFYNQELRRQRDALVLNGTRVRAPTVRLLEAEEVLQVPQAIKGRPPGQEGSQEA